MSHYSNLLGQYQPLNCSYCLKDILLEPKGSVAVFIRENITNNRGVIIDFQTLCSDKCSHKIKREYNSSKFSFVEYNIEELTVPFNFLSWSVANFEVLHNVPNFFVNKSFFQFKTFYTTLSQCVMRNQTEEEISHVNTRNNSINKK